MSRERGGTLFRRNFAWAFVGNFVFAACQWAMIVLVAKLGTPEDVGLFALGAAVTGPIMLLTSLKLRTVQATDATHEYLFCDYFTVRGSMTFVALLTIGAITRFAHYGATERLVILAVGITKSAEALGDVVYGLFQQHERMDWVSQSLVVKGALSLIAMAGVLLFTHSIVWACASLLCAPLLVLFAFDIGRARVLLSRAGTPPRESGHWVRWRWRRQAQLALRSLPLGLSIALGSLFTNIPRYFIENSCGTRELGIFAALSYLIVAGNLIVNALGQSAAPRLARQFAAGQLGAFRRLVTQLLCAACALGACGVVAAVIFGRPLLALLYRPEYSEHSDVLIWLAAASGVGYAYVFIGTAIGAMRRFAIQAPVHVVSTSAMVLACWFLVPRYGIIGAAWAVLACTLLEGGLYAAVGASLLVNWRSDIDRADGGEPCASEGVQ